MLHFEYIRAIEPPTEAREDDEEPASPLAPIPAEPNAKVDADDGEALDQLVADAREEAGADPHADLATPPPLRFQLPSFLGVPLACARLEPDRPEPDDPAPEAGSTRGLMALLGPGMVTMSLAVAATVAFGAFVVTR